MTWDGSLPTDAGLKKLHGYRSNQRATIQNAPVKLRDALEAYRLTVAENGAWGAMRTHSGRRAPSSG